MTIKEYSYKVKDLEIKLDVLDAIYEEHGDSLDLNILDELETEKKVILNELMMLTAGVIAAIGTRNTRMVSLHRKESSVLGK